MTAQLSFCGGVGTVTGANFLLETGELSLLVDCGLVQGGKVCENANYEPFPYNPASVHYLFVTHAHLDHIGRIPKLVRDGFRGTIYSTPATRALVEIMFQDAIDLLAEEAERCGKEPLYGAADLERALSLWREAEYGEAIHLSETITATLQDAGHILGSAMVRLIRGGRTILFTGDLGNSPDVLLQDTASPRGAHYMVMESVYGERNHEDAPRRRDLLHAAVEEARAKHGVLLIPSFSLHRTQSLLYELNGLIEDKKMLPIRVFLDSPLAIRVLDAYRAHPHLFNATARARIEKDDDVFAFPHLSLSYDTADSRAIAEAPNPKVIIAGSGMSHGGRIRAHERHYLGDRDATILFVGYQTPHSLGRKILDGMKKVVIDDEWIRVRAHVRELSGYSAHKGRDDLVAFVEETAPTLEQVFVTMGEPKSALFLTQRLREFLGVHATAPALGNRETLAW